MIQFARAFAGSGLFWLWASLALAQAPEAPPAAAAEAEAPAAKAAVPAAKTAAAPARRPGPRVTAATPECAWTGRRIVGLLVRDDVDPADKFLRFYESFGCPTSHIGPALRCVVTSDGTAEGQAKALTERVDACWDKPSLKFLNR